MNKGYLIQFEPSKGYRTDKKGNPIVYHSDFDAMVAVTQWANETQLPTSHFLVVENTIDKSKYAGRR
jgi:hypothetical protein